MNEYGIIGVFLFLGSIFVGGGIITSWLFGDHSPDNQTKRLPYECGESIIGDARIQFKVGFYLFALLFLIFEVEALFLFPCVGIFRAVAEGSVKGISTSLVMVELAVFVSILGAGLVFAWRKGLLKWE